MILNEKIFVFDEIIKKETQLVLHDYFENNYKNWIHFKKDISHGDLQDVHDYEFPGYTVDLGGKINVDDKIIEIVKEIESIVLKKIELESIGNYRYKLSCYPPINPGPTNEDLFRQVHIDRIIPHLVMVYYVNNTEGNTTIFRNKIGCDVESNNKVKKEALHGDFKNLEIIESISPKQGRIVIFDGGLLHSPGWPINQNRYIINFNTIIKSKNKSII